MKPDQKHYVYDIQKTPFYSMALTQATFMHREYLRMFTDRAPPEMTQMIDTYMNCEDIAMNMIVSDFCQCAAGFRARNLPAEISEIQQAEWGKNGLHHRPGHYTKRSECMNKFAEHFQSFPLKYVNGDCVY